MYKHRTTAELEELHSQVAHTPLRTVHWGRDGRYIWFHDLPLDWVSVEQVAALYPATTLYPSTTLSPSRGGKYIVFDPNTGPVMRDGPYITIGGS